MSDNQITSEEIDALMQAVGSGCLGAAPKRESRRDIKPYDFAHPDKFSKEQLRSIEIICTGCARGLATQLSALLKTPAEVDARSVSEGVQLDLVVSMPATSVLAVMSIPPLAGPAVLSIDPDLVFALVERLLGGQGRALREVRDLTQFETGLMSGQVVGRIGGAIADAWRGIITMKPATETILSATRLGEIEWPSERLIITDFSVRYGGATGSLRFGMPVTALDPVLSKLSNQHRLPGVRADNNDAHEPALRGALDRTQLDLCVLLGSASVTMRDLLDLQVGDLVCLDRKAGSELDVLVESRLRYRGQPGQVGRQLGLKVTRILSEEE